MRVLVSVCLAAAFVSELTVCILYKWVRDVLERVDYKCIEMGENCLRVEWVCIAVRLDSEWNCIIWPRYCYELGQVVLFHSYLSNQRCPPFLSLTGLFPYGIERIVWVVWVSRGHVGGLVGWNMDTIWVISAFCPCSHLQSPPTCATAAPSTPTIVGIPYANTPESEIKGGPRWFDREEWNSTT